MQKQTISSYYNFRTESGIFWYRTITWPSMITLLIHVPSRHRWTMTEISDIGLHYFYLLRLLILFYTLVFRNMHKKKIVRPWILQMDTYASEYSNSEIPKTLVKLVRQASYWRLLLQISFCSRVKSWLVESNSKINTGMQKKQVNLLSKQKHER